MSPETPSLTAASAALAILPRRWSACVVLVSWLAGAPVASAAFPASLTLDLDPSQSEVQTTLEIAGLASEEESLEFSGTIDVQLELDLLAPGGPAVAGVEFLGADMTLSDEHWDISDGSFIEVDVDTSSVGASLSVPASPSVSLIGAGQSEVDLSGTQLLLDDGFILVSGVALGAVLDDVIDLRPPAAPMVSSFEDDVAALVTVTVEEHRYLIRVELPVYAYEVVQSDPVLVTMSQQGQVVLDGAVDAPRVPSASGWALLVIAFAMAGAGSRWVQGPRCV